MLPSLTTFSAGYNLLDEITVEETNQDNPRINDHLYASLQDQSYQETASPIVFRYPGSDSHFTVEPSGDIPTDVIELPGGLIDEWSISPVPTTEGFLVARPGHAVQLVQLASIGNTVLQ